MDKYTNEIIAEWVGFKERFTSGNLSSWWEFDGYPLAKCPDFMNSESDCFKFIIPKLRDKGYGIDISVGRAGAFANIWNIDEKQGDNSMHTTALGVDVRVSSAICMAVLELVTKEWVDGISSVWYTET